MSLHPTQALGRSLPQGVDAALIISPVNRQYYTEMPSSEGVLLVTRSDAFLLIDFRYIERARRLATGCKVLLRERLYDQLRELVDSHKLSTLVVETDRMTVEQFSRLQAELPGCTFLNTPILSQAIAAQRAVKTERELSAIRSAQAITDRSFGELLNFIRVGVTERQVANELRRIMNDFGSEGDAFDIIAVSGPNSSMPHGVPGDRPLAPGDFLTLDFGAIKNGYCSDMTRTVAIGHVTDEMRRVYDTVLLAQQASFSVIRAGICCQEVDTAARRIIDQAGYEDCFGHSLGHSLGLEIHEGPNFSPTATAIAQAGNVLSVEPGIYLEGRFGVRIEDIVQITETGFENLTKSEKQLLVL